MSRGKKLFVLFLRNILRILTVFSGILVWRKLFLKMYQEQKRYGRQGRRREEKTGRKDQSNLGRNY